MLTATQICETMFRIVETSRGHVEGTILARKDRQFVDAVARGLGILEALSRSSHPARQRRDREDDAARAVDGQPPHAHADRARLSPARPQLAPLHADAEEPHAWLSGARRPVAARPGAARARPAGDRNRRNRGPRHSRRPACDVRGSGARQQPRRGAPGHRRAPADRAVRRRPEHSRGLARGGATRARGARPRRPDAARRRRRSVRPAPGPGLRRTGRHRARRMAQGHRRRRRGREAAGADRLPDDPGRDRQRQRGRHARPPRRDAARGRARSRRRRPLRPRRHGSRRPKAARAR